VSGRVGGDPGGDRYEVMIATPAIKVAAAMQVLVFRKRFIYSDYCDHLHSRSSVSPIE
jgi:hypothetical protein